MGRGRAGLLLRLPLRLTGELQPIGALSPPTVSTVSTSLLLMVCFQDWGRRALKTNFQKPWQKIVHVPSRSRPEGNETVVFRWCN